MGIKLGDLTTKKEIKLKDLNNKTIAIDAYNSLYQFISSIRMGDGSMLMDWKGRPVSHLSGLLSRTSRLASYGIKPIFVFDGKPPELKRETLNKRKERKLNAQKDMEKALEDGDLETARIKAVQTTHLTQDMVEQSKRMLELLGVPYVEAPSEGEAQASQMAKEGYVYASGSQDFDNLLFGAPILIRNLTLSGRRKLPRQKKYVKVTPEIIRLRDMLGALKIDREQLIDLALLVGTDFNPGVKGVGPKTALKLIKKFKTIEEVCEQKGYVIENREEVKNIFLSPNVKKNVKVEWGPVDDKGLKQYLCGDFGFSPKRVDGAIDTFSKFKAQTAQQSLERFF